MDKSNLLKKIQMKCPICDRVHEVEERKRVATTVIKNEKVTYEEKYYYCENADAEENEFETGGITNQNLLNARNAYRIKMDLLTSNGIIEIRENYGMSQVDLARLLGWGEATISRYESKAIQDDAYDAMLRLIKENPMQALEFLRKNDGKFSESKRNEIRKKIIDKLNIYGKEFLARQMLEGDYAEHDVPSDVNGYANLSIDKIEAMVSYFAENMINLDKIKLVHLLWYADALAYMETGSAMSGLIYRHEAIGLLPVGYHNIMHLENVNVKETFTSNFESVFHVFPCEKVDCSVLQKGDLIILNETINKFRECSTSEIVRTVQAERTYNSTSIGEIVSFAILSEFNATSNCKSKNYEI